MTSNGGWTTGQVAVVWTDTESIGLNIGLFVFWSQFEEKKSITKSYLGYIKFEILINSSKDVKRQINNYLNLKFSDHGQK